MTSRAPDRRASDVQASSVDIADEVRSAVLAVPGVACVHGGRFGEVATYLVGRRVVGVQLDDTGTRVHVTLQASVPAPRVVPLIRRAVEDVTGPPVHVYIEDIDAGPDTCPGPVDPEE